LGEVPINDFAHLSNLNVSVAYDKQKKLMFKQGEVSGVVLPLQPKFVQAVDAKAAPVFNDLVVPIVGKGSIIYDQDSTSPVPTTLSLTDDVVTDDLIAIYNFLEGETVPPGSNKYTVLNCNSINNYNNAQLVSLSPSSVFRRGLGIPFLTGITRLSNTTSQLSSLGNFIRLPDTKEFRDLTYKQKGFTFESWVHGPKMDTVYTTSGDPDEGYGTSALFKLMLACENTGGVIPDELEDIDKAEQTFSSDVVRGMVLGFTRSRQITQGLEPIETTAVNTTSRAVFFAAPTRSVNGSDVSFINAASIDNCVSGYGVLGVTVPLTTTIPNTVNKLNDVSGQFLYFSTAFDPENDEIRICVDGELVKTASLSQSFGIQKGQAIKVPSFAADNSFEYSTSSTGKSAFATGPKLNDLFTPWILGGGYTDGNMASNNGFMGSRHGLKSGLNGYMGSVKFYSKALQPNDVKKNFNSQKGFFKNIDLS
jgi:hypothetical protein